MTDDDRTVSELGEDGLVDLIAARIGTSPPGDVWVGDDAAALRAPGEGLLFTTDALVEGIDFDLAYAAHSDVGWKAMAVNASDIAAMGGRPTHAVVALALSPRTPIAAAEDLLDGLCSAAGRWGIALVGGDLSAAPGLFVSVALLGKAPPRPLLRSGAVPGDAICVTGSVGGAGAGLIALQRGWTRAAPPGLAAGAVAVAARRHLRPQARVEEGVLLGELGASAAIDVSDGVAVDLVRLLDASGVGCELDPGGLPIDPVVVSLAEAIGDPTGERTALLGGEDYELLFTVEEGRVARIAQALGSVGGTCTRIGRVVAEGRTLAGEHLDRWKEQGWDHLLNR